MDDKEDTFGWPHMDSCQLKYGGKRCTCGLLATNPDSSARAERKAREDLNELARLRAKHSQSDGGTIDG